MAKIEKKEKRIINLIIQVFGLLTAFLGLSAIVGWTLNIPQLASFDSNIVPMALSTAILFVVYGLIIFLHNTLPSSRIMFRIEVAISSAGILAAILFIYLSLNGIRPDAEHLGFKMSSAVDGLIIGHMSPVTAFCFLLVSLSLLIMLVKPGQKKLIKISLIFAGIIFSISIILLLSYLLGTPLLYEGSFIPPAITTSLALLFLGISLLLISGLKVWSYEELSNALSTRYIYILVLVFVLLIVSIITVGYSYYKSYEKQYLFGIEQDLSSIASLKVNQIVQWRKERLGNAEIFYKNKAFSNLVTRYFQNKNDLDAKTRIQAWIYKLQQSVETDQVTLIDLQFNKKIIFPENEELNASFINQDTELKLRSGEIVFQDFYFNEKHKKIYLKIYIPILDEQQGINLIGIIAIRIDPEQYLYPLINKWPTPSKTAETLIVRREGNETVFLNELKFQKNRALNLRRPLTELNLPAVQAALGKKEFMEGVDYRGVPVIAYVCPIPNSPWFLVARIDTSEVYAPLREWFWAIIIFVVVLLIGLGASIGLIWRNQRSKFHKERYQSTENIRKLNRVYAVLSSINEAIVRIRNPQELFEKACDIAIEKGRFQMAWIGKVNSQTKKVDLAASKGISEVHLKKIDFNCEGDENPLGIAGRVFKTGVHVISNDIQNDVSILPLHKESVIYGSKSFAAFPLKVFGQVWGVFKLYSSEIGFFDKKELKLLDELAMDISFAIEFDDIEAERKRAEETLIKLSSAVEQTIDTVVITDREGIIEYVNPSFEDLTGYSSEEALGKTPRILKSEKRDQKYYEGMWNTILSGNVFRAEVANKKKNGDLYYEEKTISPIFDKNKNITHFVGTGVDITERKRSEEALHESEKLYRSLFENMLNGFAYCKMIYEQECPQDFIYLAVNTSFELLTGLKDVIGKKVSEVIPGIRKSDPDLFKIYGRVALTGKPETFEIYIEALNMWFSVSVYSPAKEYFVAVFDAITERKIVEAELIASKEKAEEANRLKSNFLANMSHELRTPMVGILGFANILSSELKEPEYIEMADTILKSGSRLTDTLNSILDISRIESNKLDIKLIPVNLTEILDESVNLYKPIASSKGLYLNYSFSQKPVYIKSDKEILIRVFNNLINNAIKFTHSGGVTIKIFPPKNDSDKNVAVDIIDTGIGIPKEFNEIIFEPFRQVSDGHSRKFEGSGLGLSITKKIVELLAGSISFESTPGEGSTFTTLFPLTKSNDEIPVTGNKSSYVIETKLDKLSDQPSILLVEDDSTNASVIRAYLKDYASVDHFFDGSEGVDQCKVKLYDAVLMDINLKGIDGVEALNLIRQISEHYSKIPIIAITAYAMAGDKEKFLSLGFTHYLSKPFQRSELLSLLSEIFEGTVLVS